MTEIISKYYSEVIIQNIINENNFDKEVEEVFIKELSKSLTELSSDKYWVEEDDFDYSLRVCIEYGKNFAGKRKAGFSYIWSYTYADNMSYGEVDSFILECFSESKKVSYENAMNDLKMHCMLYYEDDLFTDYIIRMATDADSYIKIGIENAAFNFSKFYTEQIKKGKSEIYAFQYANLMAEEQLDSDYCEEYAYAYEKAICNGKDKVYAAEYAEKYGDIMVDIQQENVTTESGKLRIEYAKLKVEAYINGWEYADMNNLKKSGLFIDYYEKEFLNTYYKLNSGKLKGLDECTNMDECKNIALQKALEKFNNMS